MDWIKEAGSLGLGGVALLGVIWLFYTNMTQKRGEAQPSPAENSSVQALERVNSALDRNTEAFHQLTTVLQIQAAKDEEISKVQRRVVEGIDDKIDNLAEELRRHSRDCQDCHRAHQARGADD